MDKKLLWAVDKDAGEKGKPFPRIPGPSPEDKVCIVGAGPAGLHMAVELRRRNYNNIVILEKSNRVGGKCYDVHYKGRVKALGAFLATEEYFDNFIPLAKRYNAGGVVKFIRAPLIQNKKRIRLTDYLGSGPLSLLLVYIDALRYIRIHKQLFGSYEGELIPKNRTW